MPVLGSLVQSEPWIARDNAWPPLRTREIAELAALFATLVSIAKLGFVQGFARPAKTHVEVFVSRPRATL